MVDINPRVIVGTWERGYALDVHTTSSRLVYDDRGRKTFENTYSPMGELVNRLKYRGDRSAAPEIIATAVRFLAPRRASVDVIVPAPWSTERPFQPVDLIADGIGDAAHSVARCISTTRAPTALKGRRARAARPGGGRTLRRDGCHGRGKARIVDRRCLPLRHDPERGHIGAAGCREGGESVCADHDVDANQPMTTVFVGGSRSIARLPAAAGERLDNSVASGAHVVVGDAAGADKAVQRHLLDAGYRSVEIFASEGRPRHNLGDWPVRAVSAAGVRGGDAFFAAKDRAMAEVAEFGLMIWDGRSPGTVLNILRLVGHGRKAVLIESPGGRSTTLAARRTGWRSSTDATRVCARICASGRRRRNGTWERSLALPRTARLASRDGQDRSGRGRTFLAVAR